jgi:hypothetical protein
VPAIAAEEPSCVSLAGHGSVPIHWAFSERSFAFLRALTERARRFVVQFTQMSSTVAETLQANSIAGFAHPSCTKAAISFGYFEIRDKQGSRLSVQFDSKDNTDYEYEQYCRAPTCGRS